MSTTLLLDLSQTSSYCGNVAAHYNQPIILDPKKQYEIGLISATVWHSMANVKLNVNDNFIFNSGSWMSVTIPKGAYNVTDLNKTIRELITKYTAADNSELTPNCNTTRARITLENYLIIDFSPAISIASLLGFKNQHYGSITEQSISNDGDVPVNITEVNIILINCSIAPGSYSALRSQGQTIYSFSPDVPPGLLTKINHRQLIYHPINLEN